MGTDEKQNNPDTTTQSSVKADSPCPPGMVYNEETGQCEQPGGGGDADGDQPQQN